MIRHVDHYVQTRRRVTDHKYRWHLEPSYSKRKKQLRWQYVILKQEEHARKQRLRYIRIMRRIKGRLTYYQMIGKLAKVHRLWPKLRAKAGA